MLGPLGGHYEAADGKGKFFGGLADGIYYLVFDEFFAGDGAGVGSFGEELD